MATNSQLADLKGLIPLQVLCQPDWKRERRDFKAFGLYLWHQLLVCVAAVLFPIAPLPSLKHSLKQAQQAQSRQLELSFPEACPERPPERSLAVQFGPSPIAQQQPSRQGAMSRKARLFSDRVLGHLIAAELKESDPWVRDDIRQAAITVIFAQQGLEAPHVHASIRMYGVTPEKVWERIQMHRRAKLGDEYEQWYDAVGNRKPEAPRKEAISAEFQEGAERKQA